MIVLETSQTINGHLLKITFFSVDDSLIAFSLLNFLDLFETHMLIEVVSDLRSGTKGARFESGY